MSTINIALPATEQVVASAVQYLLEGNENDYATALLTCRLEYGEVRDIAYPFPCRYLQVTVRCPRSLYDAHCAVTQLQQYLAAGGSDDSASLQDSSACFSAIEAAIRSVLPTGIDSVEFSYRVELVEIDDKWRQELVALASGNAVHNQAVNAERVVIWNNHRFRSQTEVRIAIALEKANVLFLPNCKARLGFSTRENREPDFLVCHKGKWGVLEVDGPWHVKAADDHERDRMFQAHGIKVVQRFDGAECFERPEHVVKQFLFLLEKNG